MLRRLWENLDRWERRWRHSFGKDITDPRERRRSWWHMEFVDHGVLRRFWHNFEEIAPGAYRSNHPNHKRLERYAAMGIKTIVNLRGVDSFAHYLFEKESCDALGIKMIDIKLYARRAPNKRLLLELIEVFRTVDRPFLMHCKSGADRAGIASALYLMTQEGQSVEEARRMLSLRYIHVRQFKTGILDYILDLYAERNATSPIPIEDWIANEYDHNAINEAYGITAETRPK